MALRLRTDEIRVRMARHRIKSQTALAVAMGLSQGTISRQFAGVNAPSTDFIAGCLRLWPGARLRDLFELTDDVQELDDDQPAAA